MTKPFRTIALVILAYVFAALLCHSFLYDFVDRQATHYFDNTLKSANATVEQTLLHNEEDQWEELSQSLSMQLGVAVTIEEQQLFNFTDDQLLKLSQTYTQKPRGIIDYDLGLIYYPVSSEHAFVVGPFYSTILSYASELFTWLIALSITVLTITVVYRQQKKALKRLNYSLTENIPDDSNEINIRTLQSTAQLLRQSNLQKSSSLDKLLLTQKDLLHGVAHEFRSPLARMEFALGLIDEANEQQRENLKSQLEQSIVELDDLVKQVLRYSRLQYGNTGVELVQESATELIERAIEKVAHFYPNISFIFESSSECQLSCDAKLLEMALANLLRNAGRFAYSQCLIQVSCTAQYTVISIQDDGLGVPPGKKDAIFEPFTRLDPSRSRDSGGYGLGLAIVKSIITKHSGTVTVEDAPNRGANFIITLSKA